MPDYNSAMVQNAIAQATANANDAYQQGMLENQRQDLAFRRAQQAWKETMDKAGLTGMYEGQYTMPTQQWFATQFGTWGTPTAGQQTLGGQQQQWQQAFDTASQYGQYYGLGQAPAAGTQTQAAQQQAFAQALQTQQEQRAAQAQQQSQTQAYLNLLAGLRGPADWAKYQQVLGSTPQGMRDLYAAAMGQYVPGGGATTGYAPEAASLQSMMGQIGGMPYNPAAAQQPLNMANVYQGGQGSYGQQANPAVAALQGQPVAGQQAMQQQAQQAYTQTQLPPAAGGGTNMMGANQPQTGQPAMGNLPAPNQIAPQSWQNLAPSQKEMLLGEYESQGWHKPDVEALFAQSLPKYTANAPTAGTFRMR